MVARPRRTTAGARGPRGGNFHQCGCTPAGTAPLPARRLDGRADGGPLLLAWRGADALVRRVAPALCHASRRPAGAAADCGAVSSHRQLLHRRPADRADPRDPFAGAAAALGTADAIGLDRHWTLPAPFPR